MCESNTYKVKKILDESFDKAVKVLSESFDNTEKMLEENFEMGVQIGYGNAISEVYNASHDHPFEVRYSCDKKAYDKVFEGEGVLYFHSLMGEDGEMTYKEMIDSPSYMDAFAFSHRGCLNTGDGHHVFFEAVVKRDFFIDGYPVYEVVMGS